MISAATNISGSKIITKDFFYQQKLIVQMLIEIIGLKDPSTQNHSIKVAEYAELIAKDMKLSKNIVKIVKYSGYVHDFGKMAVPVKVLNKPASLSNEEFQIIKKHPEKGAELLNAIPGFSFLIPAVLYHHERYDGQGYPGVYKGNDIPLMARITSVADAFDAMTNYRSYRNQLSINEALEELEVNAGKQFDSKVVKSFKNLVLKKQIKI